MQQDLFEKLSSSDLASEPLVTIEKQGHTIRIQQLGIEARQRGDSVIVVFQPQNHDRTERTQMPLAEAEDTIMRRWRRFKASSPPIRKLLYEEWTGARYQI